LDFDQETSFSNFITQKPLGEIQAPTISFNPNFNPFDDNESGSKNNGSSRTSDYASSFERKTAIPQNWDTLYQVTEQEQPRQIPLLPDENEGDTISFHGEDKKQFFQIHNRYIVSQIHSGFILIDQQAAHERILFEQYLEQLEQHKGSSQQSLFPVTIELQSADFALMTELLPDLQTLGFQLRPFGKTTYIIDGIPADLGNNVNEAIVIEKLLEDIKNNKSDLQLDKRENLAKSLARSAALKAGTALSNAEMSELIDKLFACQSPNISVNGKPTIVTFSLQDLMEKFDKI
jgi:DNA mismatch repair protein MutL